MLTVESLTPEGTAAAAGVHIGDHVAVFNGLPLLSPAHLQALSENAPGPEPYLLGLIRKGQPLELAVPAGSLGLTARPELPLKALPPYLQGRSAAEAGVYADALAHLTAALTLIDDPQHQIWLRMRIGELHEKQSDWQQALAAYEQAQAALPPEEASSAAYLCEMALGRCWERCGEYMRAGECYSAAQDVAQRSGALLWQARSLHSLGNSAYYRSDLMAAADCYRRSLEIRERLIPGSLEVAYNLSNLGLVAQDRGELAQAIDLHQRALAIFEQRAPDSLTMASGLNNLGTAVYEGGDLARAEGFLRNALEIQERLLPGSMEISGSLNNLGVLAKERGDLATAESFYHRALEIIRQHAPNSLDMALNLNNLGNVVQERGDLATAENFHRQALEIRKRLFPESLEVAISLNNLGEMARSRKDLAVAEDYHRQALKIRERLAPGSIHAAYSLNNLGIIAHDRGEMGTAQDYFLRALEIRKRLAPESLDVTESLYCLSSVYQQQQRYSEALPLLQEAVRILENQRSQIASPHARSLLLAQHLNKYLGLLRSHLALDQFPEAFATVERCRARSLLEMLTERALHFDQDAPIELQAQQQTLTHQRRRVYDQLGELAAIPEHQSEVEQLRQQLRDLEQQQQRLTERIRLASPRYADLQYPQPLDLASAQASLDPGTLALVYQADAEQTYLFALTSDQFQQCTLPLGRDALAVKVQSFREVLDIHALENTLDEAQEQAKELYGLLLAPVQSLLETTTRLLLCPDGALHTLPWTALICEREGKLQYLGAERPIHTTLSLTIYAQTIQDRSAPVQVTEHQTSRSPAGAAKQPSGPAPRLTSIRERLYQTGRRLLALGDPLYPLASSPHVVLAAARSVAAPIREPETVEAVPPPPEPMALRGRGMHLQPLPFTRQEVEEIGQLFGAQATLYLGEQATKTAALAACREAVILHFACHGWLDPQHPLSSGLLLSQPEALGDRAIEGDNGLLQAWEIFESVKLDAELVVLSACQSGLGQEVKGEGLIGLTRAFQYAGARSLLVSLWKINDASTTAFMQAFYRAIKAGACKDAALQAAVRQMSAHPHWSHPYYWAAFTLHGDWI